MANYENSIQGNYPQVPFLSPLWQVIYQEGIRSNHLLFKPLDVQKFEREEFAADNFDHISETMVSLLSCADLTASCSLVESLPYAKRKAVYRIYCRFLETWRVKLKNSLN